MGMSQFLMSAKQPFAVKQSNYQGKML